MAAAAVPPSLPFNYNDYTVVGNITSVSEALKICSPADELQAEAVNWQAAELDDFLEFRGENTEKLWFRGQSNQAYGLVPGAFRNEAVAQREKLYFERFRVGPSCKNYMSLDPRVRPMAIACDMQHYGLPTRVLDWSESFLVALFFACNDEPAQQDGALFVLDAYRSDVAYFSPGHAADDVLTRLTVSMGQSVAEHYSLSHSPDLRAPPYNYGGPAEGAFLNSSAILPVRPFQTNPYVLAQKGVFTLHGGVATSAFGDDMTPEQLHNAPPPVAIPEEVVRKFIIPHDSKHRIRRELASMHITQATLFPSVDTHAAGVRDTVNNLDI